MRSITELSASPSFADQVVAQSLEKFVASMPEPEANSARAMREADERRRAQQVVALKIDRGVDAPAPTEPLSTLARLKALRDKTVQRDATPALVRSPDKLAAPERPLEVADRLQALIERANKLIERKDDGEAPDATNERLRALIEKTSRPVAPIETDRADEIVRQVQERDRAQQERDQARDRDGPGR